MQQETKDRKDWIGPSRRRSAGPRMQRRRQQRRASRKRSAGFVLLSIGVSAVLLAGAAFLGKLAIERRSDNEAGKSATEQTQETWLVYGTIESDTSGEASWLTLMSWDRKGNRSFFMYIPRTTFVEVPGYGGTPESVGKALSLGKEPLLLSTLSNLMGVKFDHYLRISDQATRAFFDKIGGLDMDIEQKLTQTGPDGRVRVIFAEGAQHLDGKRVAELITYLAESGDEISRAVRHARVWSALIDRFRTQGGDSFGKLMVESKDLFVTDAQPPELERFFGEFASVPKEESVYETMPVQAQGVDSGIQYYKADVEAIQKFAVTYLAGSRAVGSGEPGRRVQILNGNGTPGIGQEVAEKLIPKGFRVVLDANAKRFDYDVTQIVIYSDSKTSLALAEDVRKALGVGEIIRSKQRQTVVDMTIVVGSDYLKKR